MNELIDKKIGNEIDGSIISDLFNGYIFKITGGYDDDGFAMKNGILTQGRKKILLQKGSKNFRYKNDSGIIIYLSDRRGTVLLNPKITVYI